MLWCYYTDLIVTAVIYQFYLGSGGSNGHWHRKCFLWTQISHQLMQVWVLWGRSDPALVFSESVLPFFITISRQSPEVPVTWWTLALTLCDSVRARTHPEVITPLLAMALPLSGQAHLISSHLFKHKTSLMYLFHICYPSVHKCASTEARCKWVLRCLLKQKQKWNTGNKSRECAIKLNRAIRSWRSTHCISKPDFFSVYLNTY